MKAFHGDQAIKDKFVARVKEHMLADAIIQGEGWDGHRGCSVGCILEKYDHKAYPEELGLPVWIAHLQDRIHEELRDGEFQKWPLRFLQAVPIGADIDKIKIPFLIWLLNDLALPSFDQEKHPDCKKAILDAIDALKTGINADVARAAADAADDAAAYAADDAYAAARAAAYAADDAADAARADSWEKIADKLVELLEGCK